VDFGLVPTLHFGIITSLTEELKNKKISKRDKEKDK